MTTLGIWICGAVCSIKESSGSQNQWVQKVTVWILLEVTSLQINLLPVKHSLPQFGVPYNTGIPN